VHAVSDGQIHIHAKREAQRNAARPGSYYEGGLRCLAPSSRLDFSRKAEAQRARTCFTVPPWCFCGTASIVGHGKRANVPSSHCFFRTAESTRCSPALLAQSDGSRFLEIRSMLRKQERVAVCCSAGRVRLVGSRHSNMVRIAEEPIDRVSRAPAWEARRLDKRTLPLRQGRVSSVAPS
jgi:hypothetical protein